MNNIKTVLIVITVIILSVLFPGHRSYAAPVTTDSVMVVNTDYTLELVAKYCVDTADKNIDKFGLIPNMTYQESLNEHTYACTKTVLNNMTNR